MGVSVELDNGFSVMVNNVNLDETKRKLFLDVSLKKGFENVSTGSAKSITGKNIRHALLNHPVGSALKEKNIVIEKCQPPLRK
jgi:hypothetical protein